MLGSIAISADPWPDHVRLSNLEPRFVCKAARRAPTFGRTSIGTGSRSRQWAIVEVFRHAAMVEGMVTVAALRKSSYLDT
jgi:hypothetical protein